MSESVRINITISKELLKELKDNIKKGDLSNFLEEAAEEKLRKELQQKALTELFDESPVFEDIKDPVKWVRELRNKDNKRLKRAKI
jgi:hypothetical protein